MNDIQAIIVYLVLAGLGVIFLIEINILVKIFKDSRKTKNRRRMRKMERLHENNENILFKLGFRAVAFVGLSLGIALIVSGIIGSKPLACTGGTIIFSAVCLIISFFGDRFPFLKPKIEGGK